MRRNGFTLLELIIVSGLAAMFIIFLSSMGVFGAKTFKSSQTNLSLQANVRFTTNFIVAQLRNAEFVYLTEPVQPSTYDKIYYDSTDKKIMYLKAGTTTPVVKSYAYFINASDVMFTLSVLNGKYYFQMNLTAKSGTHSFPVSTKILLNNTSVALATSGTAIWYKQPSHAAATTAH